MAETRLERLADRAMIDLRGDAADPAFARAAGAVLGAVLPQAGAVVATADGGTIVSTGPDAWLVIADVADATPIADAFDAALDGLDATATDVSGNRIMLRLHGPAARDILAAGCSLDLAAVAFPPGRCAGTLVARAQVLLIARDDAIDLLPRRSFGPYLGEWIEDALVRT